MTQHHVLVDFTWRTAFIFVAMIFAFWASKEYAPNTRPRIHLGWLAVGILILSEFFL